MSEDGKKSLKGVPKPRSPGYPGINLEEAITRARQVYANEREHEAPLMAIVTDLGYTSNNGPARVTAAALKYFGLIDFVGTGDNRKGKLNHLALDIILDDRPGSIERENSIKIAALKPAIHSEIWNKYSGDLPSDQSLKFTLRRDKGFTERGANEFLQQFRSTLSYAKLTSSYDMPNENHASLGDEDSNTMNDIQAPPQQRTNRQTLPPLPASTGRDVQLPLSSTKWATLRADFPLSETAWNQMIAILQAMKPALVSDQKDVSKPEGDT